MNGKEAFEEANDIIWEIQKNETHYRLITSDYFMSREDFIHKEFECTIAFFNED